MTAEGTLMGSLHRGYCVTERKVQCCVRNALKTEFKTRCPPCAPLSPFLLHSAPTLARSVSTNDPRVLPHCGAE